MLLKKKGIHKTVDYFRKDNVHFDCGSRFFNLIVKANEG